MARARSETWELRQMSARENTKREQALDTKRERVLRVLRDANGAWVHVSTLSAESVGGARYGGRIYDLTLEGWMIEGPDAQMRYRLLGKGKPRKSKHAVLYLDEHESRALLHVLETWRVDHPQHAQQLKTPLKPIRDKVMSFVLEKENDAR